MRAYSWEINKSINLAYKVYCKQCYFESADTLNDPGLNKQTLITLFFVCAFSWNFHQIVLFYMFDSNSAKGR